jgi:GMP synthase (glutamine-hydrolysing)
MVATIPPYHSVIMPQSILIVLHSETSTPGRVGRLLVELGYALDIRKPCLGEDLPPTMAGHAGAVIFGGPMSANDSDDYIRREIDWIGVPLKEKKPFLGICLGAQMLSKHLGGDVAPHPEGRVEIGYYPLEAVGAGKGLGPWPSHVYHWHREGFTLPKGTTQLARSDDFENQAFSYGEGVYGLQFHPEVTRLIMHRWAVSGAHRFVLNGAKHGHQHLEDQLMHDAAVHDWLVRFLELWLKPALRAQRAA